MQQRSITLIAAALFAATSIGVVALRSPVIADVSDGDRPVLVPIAPCRLADTRPAPNTVGPRSGAIGPGETLTIATIGTNGNCDLPDEALAVSLNVTALSASDLSFLTFWPEGDRPLAASLNPAPGQPPVPNAVTTSIGADGAFRVYNDRGSVHAVIDVNGYFAHHDHDDRYDTSAEVDDKIADATAGLPGSGSSYTKQESDERYYERDAVDGAIGAATDGLLTADNVYTKPESDSRYYEQSVADQRFHEGDNVVLVPADGTPVENGAAFTAALAAITDATAATPYLVRLGAGEFDVGAGSVALPNHVSVAGAGRSATIVTSTGVTNNFRADNATLMLADGVSLSDLTVRNTGGADSAARPLLGSGEDFLVDTVRLEAIANGAQVAVGFEGGDISGAFDFYGVLNGVSVHVDAGSAPPSQAGGFGQSSSSGDMSALTIRDSDVLLNVRGIGLGDLQGDCCDSVLVVEDTSVTLTAGGIGAGTTNFDRAIYDGVLVEVSGGDTPNIGFTDAGSGFRPEIMNSQIIVNGTGATGIQYNNGRPFVTNSTIDATTIGINASSGSSFSGTATVENSVIISTTALRASTVGGSQRFRIGGTLLDANTLLDVPSGAVDARCADVHTDDHETVSGDCATIAADPVGERTLLVTGGGSDAQNGAALVDAVSTVVASSPSDGDEWTIRLEPGTYEVTSTIVLPAHLRLEGAGLEESAITCSTCTLFTATGPVTLADLTIRSATESRIADFQGGARLERIHVDISGASSSPDGIRLDGARATVLDSTVLASDDFISQTAIESRVDELTVDGLVVEGRRPGVVVEEGSARIGDSSLVQVGVDTGTTVELRDTVVDASGAINGGASAFAMFGGGTVTIVGGHIIGRASSVMSMSGATIVVEQSTIERTITSGFPLISAGAGSITLLHSSVNDNVSATTETCFATVHTDTGTFLPDTCP